MLIKNDQDAGFFTSLLTGRPHQLRFEMSKHGFSIIGDALYGSKEKFHLTGIALRAFQIDLSHVAMEKCLGLPNRLNVEELF